jgi:cytochrome c553
MLGRTPLLAIIAFVTGLTPSFDGRVQQPDVAPGQALAARLCAKCHLNPGQGEKTSPSSIPGFRAIAKRPNQSLHGIVAWLKRVPPMMPNHRLTQDEMFQLADYILTLRDEPPGDPPTPQRQ